MMKEVILLNLLKESATLEGMLQTPLSGEMRRVQGGMALGQTPSFKCPDRGHFAYGRRGKGWGASKTLSFLREDGKDRTLKLRDQVLTFNCQKPAVHHCNEHQGKVVAEGMIHRELRR